MSNPVSLRGALLVGLMLASGAMHAGDKSKTGSFGKGKANGPLLTRAELRECLALQERVRALTGATVAEQAELDKHKAEIARLDTTLNEQLGTLDRTRADAVDSYNAQVGARDKMIEAYNARTPEFNAKVDALQTGRSTFAKACENRDFDEKDEAAIRRAK